MNELTVNIMAVIVIFTIAYVWARLKAISRDN